MSEDDIEIEEVDENADPKDTLKKLREKLALAVKEKQEYLDGWQRLRADFLNYRKRMEEDIRTAETKGKMEVVGDALAALESFDMAMGNKEIWEKVEKNWRVGVEYIYQQLLTALETHGLEIVTPKIGDPFEPAMHQAVESVHTDEGAKDHTVAEVVQKGYALDGNPIRPPKVKVFSKEG